jgi:hypothetical protein
MVKAIEWAIAQKVDIINLSLVLFRDHRSLSTVIDNARKEGIVVFCSTADMGYVAQPVWPAKYAKSHDCIFPVAACNAHGRFIEYSSETDAQYAFQGEDILASDGNGPNAEAERRVSGSSVATAMATGVASLVLSCYRILLNIDVPSHMIKQSFPSNQAAIIKNVFANMCHDHNSQETPPRIMPWFVFPTKASDDDQKDGMEQGYTLGEAEDIKHWIIERFQHSMAFSMLNFSLVLTFHRAY